MAVDFITNRPHSLLDSFKARIDQADPSGRVNTWEYDADGDFTHKAPQWHLKAWMRPNIREGKLTFGIIGPEGKEMPYEVYGYYHGHLTETFLNHFDLEFSSAQSTALPTGDDYVRP
ncbi:hypothetical protein [Pseudomonas baltica]|uniref:hypothetical protein n=1 Tax=Pseudomonas baltica TaxID=2762576 RepID=UPI0028996A32|nr:hypothetical protein [Pseudomonas baltica]